MAAYYNTTLHLLQLLFRQLIIALISGYPFPVLPLILK